MGQEEGKVRWFNDSKGYGFICDSDGEDLFVHVSELQNTRTLEEGAKVSFDREEGQKGWQAVKVKVVED